MTSQEMYAVYVRHRDAQGLKDYNVAKGSGVNPSTFTEWRQGHYTPKLPKLLKIARFLGFPVEEFAE